MVEGNLKTIVGLVYAVDSSLSEDINTTLAHNSLESLSDVLVEWRQNLLHKLDNCHLNAKAAEHAGKLHTYHTTTHDAQALGKLLHSEDIVASHRQIGALDGKSAWNRTSGNHDCRSGVLLTSHLNGLGLDKFSLAIDNGDAVAAHEHSHAVAQLLNDFFLARKSHTVINSHLASGNTKLCSLTHGVDNLGIAAKSLGGDATAVKASATQQVALHDHHLLAVVSSLGGHLITAGACTYNNNVG